MSYSTFSGPVRSLSGFINIGPNAVVNIPNGTDTLTVSQRAHAGRIIRTNDATLVITLPTIVTTAANDTSGPDIYLANGNNIGMSFTFVVETAATAWKLITSGSDRLVGALPILGAAGATTSFAAGANTVSVNLNGSLTGGVAGSTVTVTALAGAKWFVTGFLIGSGSTTTPFADT